MDKRNIRCIMRDLRCIAYDASRHYAYLDKTRIIDEDEQHERINYLIKEGKFIKVFLDCVFEEKYEDVKELKSEFLRFKKKNDKK